MIKRILIVIMMLSLLLSFTGCKQAGKTDNVKQEIGASDQFSVNEISQAMEAVKKKFKDFSGCELIRLWYDEEASDREVQVYLTNGRGASNGAKKENVIVLFSDFTTDDSVIGSGFNPNSTYAYWHWTLIRTDSSSAFTVDGWGY